jgi:regulator of sigma E protease
MFSILGAILAIGLLIVVHEAGHYFVARWCNMRVDRFSIGFGPPVLSWKRGETDFTIGPVPFGGFVQINGMTVVDEVDPDDERQYPNRPVWQRFATIFAGPGMNYVTAIVAAFILYIAAGAPTGTSWYVVGGTVDGFPAAGLVEPGDKIVKINGNPYYYAYEGKAQKTIQEYVQESKGEPMMITVERDGSEVEIPIAAKKNPKFGTDPDQSEYLLGITFQRMLDTERAHIGFGAAVTNAISYPIRQTKVIGKGLYDVVTGKQKGELSGPVGIATMAKKQFDIGWIRALEFLMLLNVYIGLFNLLPLPALDGGRLVFLGYEMATRRRANPKVEATVHMVGIMALLLIMVLVTYKDIARLF